jgi:hypothetical protein
MKITLKWDEESGDGKCASIVSKENDGWKDLRLTLNLDDCDDRYARKAMKEVIRRCNAANT